jgi:hypothetical protein
MTLSVIAATENLCGSLEKREKRRLKVKFLREKVSALSGETEVRFTEIVEGEDKPFPPFRLIATKLGVRFEGRSMPVTSIEELQDLAKVVSDAWTAHRSLQPKLEEGVKDYAKKL